jgi:hypothetical protein
MAQMTIDRTFGPLGGLGRLVKGDGAGGDSDNGAFSALTNGLTPD